MKPKTTILMVLAIGCGGAAAFMTNKLIAERNKGGEEIEKVQVLVAKAGIKKIAAMSFVKKPDEFFELQEKSKNDVPKNTLTDLTDKSIKDGFRVSRAISEGNFLTSDDIISKDSEGITRMLPPGMRALGIRVTPESLAGGFVLPGARVDVVWTFRTTTSDVGSLTILQDMLVLAVDTQSTRNPDSPQTILGATATLAVKPEEAQKLSLASLNGDIRLSLRSPADTEKVQLVGSRPQDLTRISVDSGGERTESDGGDKTASAPATQPPVPALPPLDAPKSPTATTPEAPAVVEKPKKIHILRVEDGANVLEHKFPWDEEKQTWVGSVKRSAVEPK